MLSWVVIHSGCKSWFLVNHQHFRIVFRMFQFLTILSAIILLRLPEFSSNIQTETIYNLTMYHMSRQLYPKTFRVISYENPNSSIPSLNLSEILNSEFPVLQGNNKPLIKSPDPRSISTGRMVGFIDKFKYVVIIFINYEDAYDQFIENLKKTVNRRWDRVLIITETSQFLKKIMEHETVQDLKEKFLYSLDQPDKIWVDPLIYDGGRMIFVGTVGNVPEKKKMGGNLHGRHMKVAGCEFRPWMYRTGKDSAGRYTFDGNHVKIVQAASEKFNYTYEVSYDPSYGEFWPENQTWTGMYSRVYYPEKGFHFTLVLSYEYDWSYGVDYPSTINTCELMFLTNQPQFRQEWYAFMLPFQIWVWFWIIVSFVFLGIIQFFVMYFYHERKLKYLVWDSACFLPYAMAMEQGLCEIPKGARYLSLIWLLGCTVLGTGYKATLRQKMSFPTPETIPLTFEELAERPNYKITLYTLGSLERAYIQGSNMPALINIRGRMGLEYDVEKCLRGVYQTPHSVCMGWSSLIIQETARSLTVNTRVEPLVFSKSTPKLNIQSMAFQKDSIFVDSYFGITEGVFESGLVGKWEYEENLKFKKEGIARLNTEKDTKLYELLIEQTKQDDTDRKPLSMNNLWVIFLFLPLGFILGAILFGIEHYIWNKIVINDYFMEKYNGCFRRNNVIEIQSALANRLNVQVRGSKIIIKEKERTSQQDDQEDGDWYDPFGVLGEQKNALVNKNGNLRKNSFNESKNKN